MPKMWTHMAKQNHTTKTMPTMQITILEQTTQKEGGKMKKTNLNQTATTETNQKTRIQDNTKLLSPKTSVLIRTSRI